MREDGRNLQCRGAAAPDEHPHEGLGDDADRTCTTEPLGREVSARPGTQLHEELVKDAGHAHVLEAGCTARPGAPACARSPQMQPIAPMARAHGRPLVELPGCTSASWDVHRDEGLVDAASCAHDEHQSCAGYLREELAEMTNASMKAERS